MASDAPTYWDYVKAAFTRSPRVGALGGMPINQMGLFVFGLLGLVNPGFWFLGAVAEASYLALLSSRPRFQRVVVGERLLARRRDTDLRVQAAWNALGPEARDRYRRLLNECERILGLAPTLAGGEVGALADLRAGGLNQLLTLFLRLLTSRQVISANLAQVDRSGLEADVAALRARLAQSEAESALARSLQATLDIQGRRLANLERAQASLQVFDAELERIEQQVRLIREETAVSGGPEVLSARLDAVSQTLAETSRWMDQNAELIGVLGTEELEAGGSVLPRIDSGDEEKPAASPRPPRRKEKEKA